MSNIPASKCDYYLRMHLESIEAISGYMKGGCKDRGSVNSPGGVIVEFIKLRRILDEAIEEYSK